jgi:hypothetical protein
MEALTPDGLTQPPGLSAYLASPSCHSDPNHMIRPLVALKVVSAPTVVPDFALPQQARHGSRRNRFVILQTGSSLQVAPHPASRRRSYLRLQSYDILRQGLAPC